MPLPIPRLDDRRFDDLVDELLGRAASHVSEWRPVPGDPGRTLVDLVAWLGETLIYRLNLLPERQRRAFLNLLHIPLRAAQPARGVVAIDASGTVAEKTLPPGTQLAAGDVKLVTDGELTPLPLVAAVLIKEAAADLAARSAGEGRRYFRPRRLVPGKDVLAPGDALDQHLHVACAAPSDKADVVALRKDLALGRTLSLGLVPDRATDADRPAKAATPRRFVVEVAEGVAKADEPDPQKRQATRWRPLEIVADTLDGGRKAGVLRVRLPAEVKHFTPAEQADPEYAGLGDSPPEAPADLPGPVVLWLRIRVEPAAEHGDFALAWLGVNAVEVVAQQAHTRVVGIGTGESDQEVLLAANDVDPATLAVDIEEDGGLQRWEGVEILGACGAGERCYVLDPESGRLRFGDGVHGMRPPRTKRIRAAFRAGGGAAGNVPAGKKIEVVGGASRDLKVRNEWPLEGGADAESVAEAERRIPEFLRHRDRAVTEDDFRALALEHPGLALGRAEVRAGLLPVPGPATGRRDVPGVVSVFAIPYGEPAVARPPRPTKGLLGDVFDWLQPRKVIGTELYVLSPEYVPIAVALSVGVEDPRAERTVLAAVEDQVLRWLFALPPGGPAETGWPLGRDVSAEEIEARAARVSGVLTVGVVKVWRLVGDDWIEATGGVVPLEDWQLPDLQAVSAQPGTGDPALPPVLAPPDTGDITPAPALPDLC